MIITSEGARILDLFILVCKTVHRYPGPSEMFEQSFANAIDDILEDYYGRN